MGIDIRIHNNEFLFVKNLCHPCGICIACNQYSGDVHYMSSCWFLFGFTTSFLWPGRKIANNSTTLQFRIFWKDHYFQSTIIVLFGEKTVDVIIASHRNEMEWNELRIGTQRNYRMASTYAKQFGDTISLFRSHCIHPSIHTCEFNWMLYGPFQNALAHTHAQTYGYRIQFDVIIDI